MTSKILGAAIAAFATLILANTAFAQGLPTCATSGGVLTYDAGATECWGEPDYYSITIYEMGLCSSAPTAPTTSSAYSTSGGNCEVIFQSSTGAAVSVQSGTSTSLPGPFQRPSNASYTHGYMILDNNITIGASMEFDTAMNGSAGGTGVYCWSSSTSGETTCSNTAPTSYTNFVEAVNNFGDSGFDANDAVTYSEGTLSAYLVDSAGQEAASSGVVDRLFGSFEFSSPISVTNQSTVFEASVQITNGMTVLHDGAGNLDPLLSGPFRLKLNVR